MQFLNINFKLIDVLYTYKCDSRLLYALIYLYIIFSYNFYSTYN